MKHYRLYFLSKEGHFLRAINLEAPDDATALASARAVNLHSAMEVWRGNAMIGVIEPGSDEKV